MTTAKTTLPELVSQAVDSALAEGAVIPAVLAEHLLGQVERSAALRSYQTERTLDELTRLTRKVLRRRARSALGAEQLDLGLPVAWVLAVAGADDGPVEYVLATSAGEDQLLSAEAHRETLVKDAEGRLEGAGTAARRRLDERVRELATLRELLKRLAGNDGLPGTEGS
jgi:hypothetical protein